MAQRWASADSRVFSSGSFEFFLVFVWSKRRATGGGAEGVFGGAWRKAAVAILSDPAVSPALKYHSGKKI